ncbi:hypothetical protein NPIL_696281 [Nephila pilipes]|uniref:Uncharacterized protein n=1 Tax=Nephila pilipes TaxID=299642 RepID=A0A8X6MK66_NEPPI|nr:hypothetical protein NPIL_696281 [Nephila pilipes]
MPSFWVTGAQHWSVRQSTPPILDGLAVSSADPRYHICGTSRWIRQLNLSVLRFGFRLEKGLEAILPTYYWRFPLMVHLGLSLQLHFDSHSSAFIKESFSSE